MNHQDRYVNPYFYPTAIWDSKEPSKELTKEEKLKRVEDYIEKYNIEHDEKYIYLYKAVNLDGTNIHNSDNKITFEVGKVYTEKCDQDITKDCSNGLHAGTYNVALEFGKGLNNNLYLAMANGVLPYNVSWGINNNPIKTKPVDTSKLYKQSSFRLLKVKIYKEHVIVPNNTTGKVRCNQMEIFEEIKVDTVLKYTLTRLLEVQNGYEFTFNVSNEFNNQSIYVEIISETLDITQDEINSKIKSRLDQMQKIYDKFIELEKLDGSILK